MLGTGAWGCNDKQEENTIPAFLDLTVGDREWKLSDVEITNITRIIAEIRIALDECSGGRI